MDFHQPQEALTHQKYKFRNPIPDEIINISPVEQIMVFRNRVFFFLFVGILIALPGCKNNDHTSGKLEIPLETEVRLITLNGNITNPRSELSGLTWYKETLILLPQYPDRFESPLDGSLFTIPKSAILAYLEDENGAAITPSVTNLVGSDLEEHITGFDGYEAIAVSGRDIFLAIESKPGRSMMGYVIKGVIAPDLSVIRLDINSLEEVEPQTAIDNFSDEAALIYGDSVMTFYEAWGANVNPEPIAHVFNLELTPIESRDLPSIEYRITDVTAPDESGRFWAINYLYPGDVTKINPAEDELVLQYGEGETHSVSTIVERLIEFQIIEDRIIRTDSAPIQLVLADDGQPRNWEGIVRLDGLGFLVATDQYPQTILGFVPNP